MADNRDVTCTDITEGSAECSTTSGNISALHLVITVVTLFLTVFCFYLIVTVRRRHRAQHLKALPQTSVTAVLPVGKRSKAGANVPKRIHQAIMDEFERSSSVLSDLRASCQQRAPHSKRIGCAPAPRYFRFCPPSFY